MSCVKTPPLPRSLTQLIKKCIIFCMAKMIVIMDQFSRNRKYQAYGAKAKFFLTNRHSEGNENLTCSSKIIEKKRHVEK